MELRTGREEGFGKEKIKEVVFGSDICESIFTFGISCKGAAARNCVILEEDVEVKDWGGGLGIQYPLRCYRGHSWNKFLRRNECPSSGRDTDEV